MPKYFTSLVLLRMFHSESKQNIPIVQRSIISASLIVWGAIVYTILFPGLFMTAEWYIYQLGLLLIGVLWFILIKSIEINYKKQSWLKLLLMVMVPRRFYMEINPQDWETVEFVLSKWAIIDTNRNVVIFLKSRDAVAAKLIRMPT